MGNDHPRFVGDPVLEARLHGGAGLFLGEVAGDLIDESAQDAKADGVRKDLEAFRTELVLDGADEARLLGELPKLGVPGRPFAGSGRKTSP